MQQHIGRLSEYYDPFTWHSWNVYQKMRIAQILSKDVKNAINGCHKTDNQEQVA